MIIPEVSIVVIAFNEEERLAECLRALLAQDTSLTYDVIVVDDGSRDATAQVVESIQRDHANVRLLRHTRNRGRGAARLTGQQSTQAAVIGFVDADIVVPPQWLRRCTEELSRCDAVSGIALPDGDAAVIWRLTRATLRRRAGTAEITGNNVLFARESLSLVPFDADSKLGEDFRLAKSMIRAGLRLCTLDDLVVEHREAKTYRQAIAFMWRSGIDATSLLYEFRVVRVPDLAWSAWSAVVLASVIAVPIGVMGPWTALACVAVFTLVVSCLFTTSRFSPRGHVSRFLGALVITPPLILAYLAGRCAGVVGLGFSRRSRAASRRNRPR